MNIQEIKKYIRNENIKVISFDVYDTLIERCCFSPKNVFYLVEQQLLQLGINIDYYNIRNNAEEELRNPNSSFNDIYNHIINNTNLLKDEQLKIKQIEFQTELIVSKQRKINYELYNYAISLGKKVICISDMYLSKEFIKQLLIENGYHKIDEVYVSNEYKARKSDGELYKIVLKNENIENNQLLHVGDDFNSDYINCINLGINAIHIPSSKEMILKKSPLLRDVWININDPSLEILLGFIIHKYGENIVHKKDPRVFSSISEMVQLGLWPILMHIALYIINNKNFIKTYNNINFASRDGFLPGQIYNIVNNYKNGLKANYVYAGRRAYSILKYKDYISYIKAQYSPTYNVQLLSNLIDSAISDHFLNTKIKNYLKNTGNDLQITERVGIIEIKDVLSIFDNDLKSYFRKKIEETKKYYCQFLDSMNSNRVLFFDCGYSGSISDSLKEITDKKIDKLYLWETQENKRKDVLYGNKTYVLMNEDKAFAGIELILEEFFSPLEGGCIGFDNKIPKLEKILFNETMVNNFFEIEKTSRQLTLEFCQIFQKFIPFLKIENTNVLQNIFKKSFKESPYCEINILENIYFPDPVFWDRDLSLAEKVICAEKEENVFKNTEFNNPLNILEEIYITNSNLKLGVHLHIYNANLISVFYDYFSKIEYKIDLYITTSNKLLVKQLKNNFECLNSINKVVVLSVPNIGRDVAPWLIEIKNYQFSYDLFCHIHSKESKHMGGDFGEQWRNYLLDCLITNESMTYILNAFKKDEKLGCVFPDVFPPLKNFCIQNKVDQFGMFGEKKIIEFLLLKCNVLKEYKRSDLIFSEGTMYWYRPSAFYQLFDMNLSYDDFPKEPIGVGGTIAHAIERLPTFICKNNGYSYKVYQLNKNCYKRQKFEIIDDVTENKDDYNDKYHEKLNFTNFKYWLGKKNKYFLLNILTLGIVNKYKVRYLEISKKVNDFIINDKH